MRTDASILPVEDVESAHHTVNGVRLHTVSGGDDGAPAVVLLHGFPEFFYGWRHQIGPLVEAGYRVLVPDQRGYNLSEKPREIRRYRRLECTRDIVDLVATTGRGSVHVVGHDWGGVVAWDLAARYPEVVDRLVVLNAPHPTAFERTLRSNPAQVVRSWYTIFVQLPALPEWLSRRRQFRPLERALRRTAEPGTFTDEELSAYRRAWRRPGALEGMLNWYRAGARYPPNRPERPIETPTLVVWGERDGALLPTLGPASLDYCTDGRLVRFPETGHWVPHDEPERVTELLLEHFPDP